MDLTLNQTRIIGCLIEKEITTPDQYPLSLNSLTSACNQKSNRDPVLELSEVDVQQTLDELAAKRMIREESGFGSRVVKYKHRFCNTEFGELKLSDQEQGIICVLFLRGPQTPGELRSRTNRLCRFADVAEVERVLQSMSERHGGALVVRLAREPGKRESRYAHLFSGEVTQVECSVAQPAGDSALNAAEERLQALETEVASLRQELTQVQAQLNELIG